MSNKIIKTGDICWRYFPINEHGLLCGDFAYTKAYAKNTSKRVEDGKTYLKVKIIEIFSFFGKTRFVIEYVQKDGSLEYQTIIDGDENLFKD
jgi:hypothetical protein